MSLMCHLSETVLTYHVHRLNLVVTKALNNKVAALNPSEARLSSSSSLGQWFIIYMSSLSMSLKVIARAWVLSALPSLFMQESYMSSTAALQMGFPMNRLLTSLKHQCLR